MKNVLIYIHPTKGFTGDAELLARIQIDNSLRLGWNKNDLLLYTNFGYSYNGVEARNIGSEFCAFRPRSTNTLSIPELYRMGDIEPNETYWVHDFDAYQNAEMSVSLEKDIGLTTYGWSNKWCLGSFFFKNGSKDFFEAIKETVYKYETEDERALMALTKGNINNINDRYQVLNITYNFGMRQVEHNYAIADKPIRVLHFHPHYKEPGLYPLRSFMYGENGLKQPVMSKGLVEVFHEHGVR